MRALLVVVAAAASGCGTQLVFVEYQKNLKPEVAGAGECEIGSATVEQYLHAGDGHRDQLLAALPLPPPSGHIGGDQVSPSAHQGRNDTQTKINGRYQEWRNALACYEKALEQDPSRSYAYLNMAVVSMRMADFVFVDGARDEYYARAQNNLTRARELNRLDAQTVYYQAELYARRANWTMAEKTLQELLDQKWERASVHNLLGYIYDMTDRPDKAKEEYKRAAQIDRPTASTEWAINHTQAPTQVKLDNPDDEAEPVGYNQYDFDHDILKTLTNPPKSACGWASNGKDRCAR